MQQQFSKIVNQITITPNEQDIFDTFLDFIKEKQLKTTIRVAGGWVRDKLLGLESHDIDIALDDMMGADFVKMMNEYLINKYNQKAHGFGVTKFNPEKSKHLETACVKIKDCWIDVVNLRGEFYADNSRIPTIVIGTPLQDAERRDLTINSLFYNINEKKIEDWTNKGLLDLQNEVIRTPLDPNQTFLDDPLRVLRTFRFQARFKYKISQEIFEALKNKDIKENLRVKVSRERVGKEIEQVFRHPNVFDALIQFYENDYWNIIFEISPTGNFPSIILKKAKTQQEQLAKLDRQSFMICDMVRQNYQRLATFEVLCQRHDQADIRLHTYLAAVCFPYHHIQYQDGKRTSPSSQFIVSDSLKLPKKETSTTVLLIQMAQKFDLLKRQNLEEKFVDVVNWLQEAGSMWELCTFIQYCEELVRDPKADYQITQNAITFIYNKKLQIFFEEKPLVNGGEVIKMFGIAPGADIKTVLSNVLIWQARFRQGTRENLIKQLQESKEQFLQK